MKKKFDHERQKRIDRSKRSCSVELLFENPMYNTTVKVGPDSTQARCKEAVVGKYFNKGDHTVENLQKCIGIIFTPAEPRPYFYDEYGFVEFN